MKRTSYHEIGLRTRPCAFVQEPLDLCMGQGRLEIRVEAFLDELLGESGICAVDGLYNVGHCGGRE